MIVKLMNYRIPIASVLFINVMTDRVHLYVVGYEDNPLVIRGDGVKLGNVYEEARKAYDEWKIMMEEKWSQRLLT